MIDRQAVAALAANHASASTPSPSSTRGDAPSHRTSHAARGLVHQKKKVQRVDGRSCAIDHASALVPVSRVVQIDIRATCTRSSHRSRGARVPGLGDPGHISASLLLLRFPNEPVQHARMAAKGACPSSDGVIGIHSVRRELVQDPVNSFDVRGPEDMRATPASASAAAASDPIASAVPLQPEDLRRIALNAILPHRHGMGVRLTRRWSSYRDSSHSMPQWSLDLMVTWRAFAARWLCVPRYEATQRSIKCRHERHMRLNYQSDLVLTEQLFQYPPRRGTNSTAHRTHNALGGLTVWSEVLAQMDMYSNCALGSGPFGTNVGRVA